MRFRKQSEHDEQKALLDWCRLHETRYPELRWIFAVPNGGSRHPAEAARLKAAGVKAGVPDILLLCPRGKFHGLAIEMKVPGNTPTPAQLQWHEYLHDQDYLVRVCYGWVDASQLLVRYLTGKYP